EVYMKRDNLPLPDKNGIIRALPEDLSDKNRKRIGKFGAFMFLYDLLQDCWVRPRIHKADAGRHSEIMHEVISPLRDAVVLDIACGTGGAIPHIDKSNDYTGLDLSYAMLMQAVKKAKKKGFRRYALIEGNAEELPFPEDNFDLILIDTSLHMIPQYRRCITEVARTLKKGGNMICSCPAVGINREFDALWSRIAPKRDLHSLRESDFKDVCARSGLDYDRIGINGGVLYFRAHKG
ncbi:MAG: methyltransferase domain-containing protein, partial [Deltaproteobacteria bacterium]|nr:methyltransferase domain-containing protein [Deltaproteobacteria bacterium]